MMDAVHRQIIKENRFHLEKNIDYNKLIQYLQEYKIFNRCMWEDIHSISDVLEFLPTRGPKAFHSFIEILRKTGYDAEANLLEKPNLSLQSSDNLFYKMSSIPLGYCLIINNMKFDEPDLEYREGSHIDAKSLQDFFEKAGFQVYVKPNLTSDEMFSCLIEFSKKDFTSVDSMIVIIMSHGGHFNNKEMLYGKEGGYIFKNDIYEIFSNKNCKTLQSKPKVFFFIACRGEIRDYGAKKYVPKSQSEESLDSKKIVNCSNVGDEVLPEFSDMLIINSSLPKNVTVRDHKKGTYFCQNLVSVLNEYYTIHDLETMIKLVNQKMEGKVSEVYRITQAVHSEGIVWKKRIMLYRRN